MTGSVQVANAQETWTLLPAVSTTDNTGEKPQSKAWFYGHTWWTVLPTSAYGPTSTWLFRLEPDNTWAPILQLLGAKGRADTKVVGGLAHVLITNTNSQIVSLEYVPSLRTYQIWSGRPAPTPVYVGETGTIDVDSTGRMWLATDFGNNVEVYYSDPPYSSFTGPIVLENAFGSDDIAAVVALPNNSIGVIWSNFNTGLFGFRAHVDGTDPTVWLADEVPASAGHIGSQMADDHMNFAVAADGTLYVAVKAGHASSTVPLIGLLVRHPDASGAGGTWDDVYFVDPSSGTRPIVVLNEDTQTLRVFYTSGGTVWVRESAQWPISFGPRQAVMSGTLNNVTSTKDRWAGRLVILASNGNTSSVLMTSVPGLVGNWKMDEGGGTTARDMSGFGNDADLIGAPAWDTGVNGLALGLDGSTYAVVSDQAQLDLTSALTLAAWIKPTLQTNQDLISKAVAGSVDGYGLSLSGSGTAFVRFNETTYGDAYRLDSVTAYPSNGTTWMHVAATYDGSTMRLYVNGVEETSLPAALPVATNAVNVGIGAQSDGTRRFHGALDDVRIYERALTAGEIAALATTGPVEADLAITKDDALTVVSPGQALTYAIQATNLGPSDVSSATITDVLSAQLTGATWTCSPAGGASCSASGAGSINDVVSLPAGSSVSYTLTATVAAGASGTLVNTATIEAAAITDPVSSNDSATDTDTIQQLTPPQITTQPASYTAVEPDPAVFTVAATGTAPLSYQWRRDGANIPGATSDTYVLDPTALADNGAQFSVVVSNAAGSATSTAATLTVNGAGGGGGTTPDFEVHFDTGADGFTYGDDLFRGSSQPNYASGAYVASGGFSGGALQVVVGGINSQNITNMSGGWQRSFTLASPTPVTLSFRTKLTETPYYEPDEFSQMLVSLDGVLYGAAPNDYIAQVVGGGPTTTGWLLVQIDFGTLPVGTHVLALGAYNNLKTYPNESAEVLIDDVVLQTSGTAPVAPSITTQPASTTVTAPNAASFSVAASGTAPLTYQWRRDGVDIAGATSDTYVLDPTSVGDNGAQFTVVVSNAAGTVTSAAATLTVSSSPVAPTITTQPASTTVTAPNPASFSVVASGTAPLTYQWRRNGVDIAGATSATYVLDPTAVGDNGAQFTVVVSNTAGNATSSAATLTVLEGGGPATLIDVHFDTGADAFAYADDVFRGTSMPNYASGAYLASGGFTGGALQVLVGGVNSQNINGMSGGWQRSFTLASPAAVTLSFRTKLTETPDYEPDEFSQMLVSLNGVLYGAPPNDYIAQVVGGGPTTSGWLLVQIDFGTLPAGTHVLTLGAYNNLKTYYNEWAEVLIDDVLVTAGSGAPVPPSITTQPASATVTEPDQASFSVGASGTAPLSYQWRRDGVDMPGATSATYVLDPTAVGDDGAQFSVVVSNSVGSVLSEVATLTVTSTPSAPVITTQPSSTTVTAPNPASFSVVASGTAPLGYQWRRDGIDISGATGATYVLDPTAVGDSGAQFTVVVSNAAGSATSTPATLTVNGASASVFDFDSGTDGFTYADDLFRGTSQPDYASGTHLASGGFTGGALQVIVGGVNSRDIVGMSGGWYRSLTLSEPSSVILSFRYQLTETPVYESDEYSQMLVSMDGVLYGTPPDDYVAQVVGGGPTTTGWQAVEIDFGTLDAGQHVLALGAYNNLKTYHDEWAEVLIDDVQLTY